MSAHIDRLIAYAITIHLFGVSEKFANAKLLYVIVCKVFRAETTLCRCHRL